MKLANIVLLTLLLTSAVQGSTITENTGTSADATANVDRPWYTSIHVFLDNIFNGFLQFIPDTWSSIAETLFMSEQEEENPQVIGG